jgi:hypothetical protein
MLFGTKSEKIEISDMDITADNIIDVTFEDVGTDSPIEEKPNKKRRNSGACKGHSGSGRKEVPQHLPVKVEVADIDDKDKICSHCGLPKVECKGMERISYKIGKKVVYYAIKIIRKTYSNSCNCRETEKIITAPIPCSLIPKGKYNDGHKNYGICGDFVPKIWFCLSLTLQELQMFR